MGLVACRDMVVTFLPGNSFRILPNPATSCHYPAPPAISCQCLPIAADSCRFLPLSYNFLPSTAFLCLPVPADAKRCLHLPALPAVVTCIQALFRGGLTTVAGRRQPTGSRHVKPDIFHERSVVPPRVVRSEAGRRTNNRKNAG